MSKVINNETLSVHTGTLEKLCVAEKFDMFDEYWTPKIIGEMNGQYIKLAKLKGEFVRHSHENEDEYFQVIKGTITIHLRDQSIVLAEGESFIAPKGVEHKPGAMEEAHVMMIVPKAALHTGNPQSSMTVGIENQARL